MVDSTEEGTGRDAPRRRRSLPQQGASSRQQLRPVATVTEEDADKVKAEWSEARYWAQRYDDLAQTGRGSPRDSSWPVVQKPSFPWEYSVPTWPNSKIRPGFEIPFRFYQPPETATGAAVAAPFVVKTLDDVEVPSSVVLPYTLPEVVASLKDQQVHGCALHITGVYTKVAYLAEQPYKELNHEMKPDDKVLLQVRCATILTRDIDACLACVR